MRLAVVTTPAAAPSGIGVYSARLLPELARGADVAVFVESGREGEPLAGLETRALASLKPREFDQVLYQLGNEGAHAFMLPTIRAVGGAVALHDWVLFDLAAAAFPELEHSSIGGLATVLREGGLTQARSWWRNRRQQRALQLAPPDPARPAGEPLRSVNPARERFELALNRSVVRFADAFVVHSEHVANLVRTDRNAPTPIGLVRHGAEPTWSSEPRALERERLGLPAEWRDGFLVTSLGAIRAHKRIDVLLDAVARARRSRPALHLALVGGEEPSEYDVRAALARRGLEPHVRITGRLPEAEARRWLHAGDLGVQLRGPSTGRTSGAISRTLAAGRGLIASSLAEQNELPAECVYKLHPAEDEAGRLAQKLVELADAPAVRAAMEKSARDFVERECRWETVGKRYLELCERFPRPRAARRSLFAMRLAEPGPDSPRT